MHHGPNSTHPSLSKEPHLLAGLCKLRSSQCHPNSPTTCANFSHFSSLKSSENWLLVRLDCHDFKMEMLVPILKSMNWQFLPSKLQHCRRNVNRLRKLGDGCEVTTKPCIRTLCRGPCRTFGKVEGLGQVQQHKGVPFLGRVFVFLGEKKLYINNSATTTNKTWIIGIIGFDVSST